MKHYNKIKNKILLVTALILILNVSILIAQDEEIPNTEFEKYKEDIKTNLKDPEANSAKLNELWENSKITNKQRLKVWEEQEPKKQTEFYKIQTKENKQKTIEAFKSNPKTEEKNILNLWNNLKPSDETSLEDSIKLKKELLKENLEPKQKRTLIKNIIKEEIDPVSSENFDLDIPDNYEISFASESKDKETPDIIEITDPDGGKHKIPLSGLPSDLSKISLTKVNGKYRVAYDFGDENKRIFLSNGLYLQEESDNEYSEMIVRGFSSKEDDELIIHFGDNDFLFDVSENNIKIYGDGYVQLYNEFGFETILPSKPTDKNDVGGAQFSISDDIYKGSGIIESSKTPEIDYNIKDGTLDFSGDYNPPSDSSYLSYNGDSEISGGGNEGEGEGGGFEGSRGGGGGFGGGGGGLGSLGGLSSFTGQTPSGSPYNFLAGNGYGFNIFGGSIGLENQNQNQVAVNNQDETLVSRTAENFQTITNKEDGETSQRVGNGEDENGILDRISDEVQEVIKEIDVDNTREEEHPFIVKKNDEEKITITTNTQNYQIIDPKIEEFRNKLLDSGDLIPAINQYIIGDKNTWINLKELPVEVIDIDYKERKFYLIFQDKTELIIEQGINKVGEIISIEGSKERENIKLKDFYFLTRDKEEPGKIILTNKGFLLDENAEIIFKGIIFQKTSDFKEENLLQLISEEIFILRGVDAEMKDVVKIIPSKDYYGNIDFFETYLILGESLETENNQVNIINKEDISATGDGSLVILGDINKLEVDGDYIIQNGNMKMRVKGSKVLGPTYYKENLFEIKKVISLDNTNYIFTVSKDNKKGFLYSED